MMFDAMKGLTEAIAEKEKLYTPRKELLESRIEEINRKLSLLEVGDIITISFYCHYGKQYQQITGMVRKVDSFCKTIQIEDTPIYFTAIVKISIHEQK